VINNWNTKPLPDSDAGPGPGPSDRRSDRSGWRSPCADARAKSESSAVFNLKLVADSWHTARKVFRLPLRGGPKFKFAALKSTPGPSARLGLAESVGRGGEEGEEGREKDREKDREGV
jgi:hypothetical protein